MQKAMVGLSIRITRKRNVLVIDIHIRSIAQNTNTHNSQDKVDSLQDDAASTKDEIIMCGR